MCVAPIEDVSGPRHCARNVRAQCANFSARIIGRVADRHSVKGPDDQPPKQFDGYLRSVPGGGLLGRGGFGGGDGFALGTPGE